MNRRFAALDWQGFIEFSTNICCLKENRTVAVLLRSENGTLRPNSCALFAWQA